MARSSSILVIAVALLTYSSIVSGAGDPILIVPGEFGSQLDVRHLGWNPCRTLDSSLWISESRIVNYWCFYPEMMLYYSRFFDRYLNFDDDVDVFVPGEFGNTDPVENLGQEGLEIPYFRRFVEYFMERGYERGRSIRAAPYDWRLAPDELERRGYYSNLRRLIETMYRENGNTKVTIVAHSMGGPVTLHFLTSGLVSQSWKDQHIGNFIPLSGAWAGINVALQIKISGVSADFIDTLFGEEFRDEINEVADLLTPITQSFQSVSFLLPRPSVWTDTVLVSTPTQTYTASDYERLFSAIGSMNGFTKFQGITDINENFPAPNVPTHCFYGVGVDTPESFRYKRTFYPWGTRGDPQVTMGDGDGIVNTLSSEVCLQWRDSDYTFESETFEEVDHLNIIQNEAVLTKVGQIVGADAAKQAWWPLIFGQPDDQN